MGPPSLGAELPAWRPAGDPSPVEPTPPGCELPPAQHLIDVYNRLFTAYGPQGWWPDADDPFVVAVGAILTQIVSWRNVEIALTNLRAASAMTPRALVALPVAELESLVRPAGYYTVKARRLRAFAQMIVDEFAGDPARLFALAMPELRARLLATHGIGEETADDIVVYAAGQPSFIVDAYTVRLFSRLALTPTTLGSASPGVVLRYGDWQRLFMDHLPPDAALFNEYHALIVRHGVARCRKRAPRCGDCPLLERCPASREHLAAPRAIRGPRTIGAVG